VTQCGAEPALVMTTRSFLGPRSNSSWTTGAAKSLTTSVEVEGPMTHDQPILNQRNLIVRDMDTTVAFIAASASRSTQKRARLTSL
jgi:hypothetical protein